MLQPNFDISLLPYAKIPSEKWKNAKEEVKKNTKSQPDDIIHAYHEGIDKGMTATEQVLMKSFEDNMKKAFSVSETLCSKISSSKFKINDVFLKANNISSFDVLFVVDAKNYLSDERKEAFSKAREIKKKKTEKLFAINFSFMPSNENINYDNLESDGFIFRYEIKARKA